MFRVKKIRVITATTLIACVVCLHACRKEKTPEPDTGSTHTTTPYSLQTPPGFPQLVIPEDNPLTVEGVALGRRLYYDAVLSNDGRYCAGCHKQAFGFMDSGTTVIPHVNLAWSKNFLWKGEVTGSLEDIMKFEVEDFFKTNLSKLNTHAEYPALFEKAYGVKYIGYKEVEYALAQFFRTMVSANSRYDQATRNELFLTDEELSGYTLFFTEKGDCFHCHGAPLFTDNLFHNIGLDSVFSGDAQGRFLVTGKLPDLGKFKTPSLRNVALRGSYMHDGRYTTLEEVVEHYNSGVVHSSTLDPIMTKPGKETGLKLTAQEKADLVAFLKALTDSTFINNPLLAKP